MLLLMPLTAAASAPVQPQAERLDQALATARTEQASAEARAARLEQAVAAARGDAERLARQQAAAAQAIEAAEARITAADARLRLISAGIELRRWRLASQEQPLASLVAGLAVMARRPPLLAIADPSGTDEIVAVRVLLDATMPVIRRRTAALSAELARGEQLQRDAAAARTDLLGGRKALAKRRQSFASLERQALEQAGAAQGLALSTGDTALAAGEEVERLSTRTAQAEAARAAASLASGPAAPARPFAPASRSKSADLAYQLPAAAPVVDGLGAVSGSGVLSRGIVLATAPGTAVSTPASGTIRFSGPYRDYDGVLIIDHGGGWMSVLLNVSSTLRKGTRVRIGDPIGRATGRIGVELSQNGRRVSPAIIAGSSQTLSKGGKGG
jgi:septal ring factor EnvC (AmiA/AmiB activator)